MPFNCQIRSKLFQLNKVFGGLKIVGGIATAAVGAALIATPKPTTLTKIGGVALVAYASDLTASGVSQVFSGNNTETLTNQGIKAGAEALGAEEATAQTIANWSEFGIGVIGTAGASSYLLFSKPYNAAVASGTTVPVATTSSSGTATSTAKLTTDVTKASANTTSNAATIEAKSFFEGTKYSDKVFRQMDKVDDIQHAFPKSVDGYAVKFGQESMKIGGDGKAYQWLKMSGSYDGKTGVFEYTKDANGMINHRFFNVPKK